MIIRAMEIRSGLNMAILSFFFIKTPMAYVIRVMVTPKNTELSNTSMIN